MLAEFQENWIYHRMNFANLGHRKRVIGRVGASLLRSAAERFRLISTIIKQLNATAP